ncbi:hypothetical protein FHU33_0157 [Blastococcus colisei]|uniref:Uncharacterized protein n=1 Tax=Blastococcus colisei TaxID=1564162 RepID=A0A543P9Q1_9ACTN|nr:hypothetical protein FHU33_0157 [Blastococcus colisei]
MRALGAVVVVAWLHTFLSDPPPGYYLLPGALLTVLVVAFLLRVALCSVIATADGRLTVRNIASTRTFLRQQVEVVGIDRADGWLGRGRGWAVFLVLEDGSRHRLDVTEMPSSGEVLGRLERQADEIRGWVSGRPQPPR